MDKKVNRNTHPILVEARNRSYMQGHKDGYKKGYEDGFKKGQVFGLQPYEAQINCLNVQISALKSIIAGLEKRIEVIHNGRSPMDKDIH